MKKILNTEKAPAAIGPYSQAVKAGDMVFVSGQLPIDPATGTFAGDDIKSQTRQSLINIKNILASEGIDMSACVRVGVFMKDMNMFADMNAVYSEFFETDCPARAAVEVARLPKDALVEIEAVVLYCIRNSYKSQNAPVLRKNDFSVLLTGKKFSAFADSLYPHSRKNSKIITPTCC